MYNIFIMAKSKSKKVCLLFSSGVKEKYVYHLKKTKKAIKIKKYNPKLRKHVIFTS